MGWRVDVVAYQRINQINIIRTIRVMFSTTWEGIKIWKGRKLEQILWCRVGITCINMNSWFSEHMCVCAHTHTNTHTPYHCSLRRHGRNDTLIAMSTLNTYSLASKYHFPLKRSHIYLEKWLNPGVRKGNCKSSLEYLVTKSKDGLNGCLRACEKDKRTSWRDLHWSKWGQYEHQNKPQN